MRHYADKVCLGCRQLFTPTGPRSLKCNACRNQGRPFNPPERHAEATKSVEGSPIKGTRRKLCRSRFTDSSGVTLRCELETHGDGEHKSGVWCWPEIEADNARLTS